ncbi:hypothetical protein ACO0QE_002621 [Hanseniaspora vineae]
MGTEENREDAKVDKLKIFFGKNRDKWNESDGNDHSHDGIDLKAVRDPFEDSDEASEEGNACTTNTCKRNSFVFENLRKEQYDLPMLDMEEQEHGIILNKDNHQDLGFAEEGNTEESKTQEAHPTYDKLETQKIITNEDGTQKIGQELRQELTQGNQLLFKAIYGEEQRSQSISQIKTQGATYDTEEKTEQTIANKDMFREPLTCAATQVISSNEKTTQSTTIGTHMIAPSYDDENDISGVHADRSNQNRKLAKTNASSDANESEMNKTSPVPQNDIHSHDQSKQYRLGGDASVSKIQDTTGDSSTQWFTNRLTSTYVPPTLELRNTQKSLVVMSSEYTDKGLPVTQVVFSSASNDMKETTLPTEKITQPDQEEDMSGIIIESPELKLKSYSSQTRQLEAGEEKEENENENENESQDEQNDHYKAHRLQSEKVQSQKEGELGEASIENKNAFEMSSPFKTNISQKASSGILSLRNLSSTQESDEPIKTPNALRMHNIQSGGESQGFRGDETEQEKTGKDLADEDFLISNKAEKAGEEFPQDHQKSFDRNTSKMKHSSQKLQTMINEVDDGSTASKHSTCDRTKKDTTLECSIYPTEILRKQKEKKRLNKQDITFPESVWGFYDTNFMYYPGKVLSIEEAKNESEPAVGIKFFGSLEREYLKAESVKHLAIMIGDIVLLEKSEHRVTGLECRYPGDMDIIRCIRGYDTVYLTPCKGKNKKELTKLLSSITVDVTNWCKMQLRLGDNSIIENMDWSLLNQNFEVEQPIAQTPTKLYNLRKRTKTENFYELSTQTTDTSESDRYDESEISEDDEIASANDSAEFRVHKKACRTVSRFTKDTSPLKEDIPKILSRTTTQLLPPLSRTTSSKHSPVKKPQQRHSLVCADKKLFEGCLFLLTGIDDILKNKIAESIVRHGGIYIPNEVSSVLSHNPTTDTMELDKNLEEELGTCKIRFIALITEKYRRSIKYIEMLAMGLPILHYQFIFDCFQNHNLITDFSLWKYLMPAGELSLYNGQVKSYNIYKFYQNFIVSNNISYLFQSSSINFKEHQKYKNYSVVLIIYGNSNIEHLLSFLFRLFHASNIVKIQSSTTMENKLLDCLRQPIGKQPSSDLQTKYVIYQDNLLSKFKDKHDFFESVGFNALLSVIEFERLIANIDIVDKEMVLQSVIADDFIFDFETSTP